MAWGNWKQKIYYKFSVTKLAQKQSVLFCLSNEWGMWTLRVSNKVTFRLRLDLDTRHDWRLGI